MCYNCPERCAYVPSWVPYSVLVIIFMNWLLLYYSIISNLFAYQHLKLSLYSGVKMIFNWVISSTRKIFCNFCPFISKLSMCLNYQLIFSLCPFFFLDVGVQMIMPTFSALLTNSSRKVFGNFWPVFRTELLHKLEQFIIFLW